MKNNICNTAYPAELVKFAFEKKPTISCKYRLLSFSYSYRKQLYQFMTFLSEKEIEGQTFFIYKLCKYHFNAQRDVYSLLSLIPRGLCRGFTAKGWKNTKVENLKYRTHISKNGCFFFFIDRQSGQKFLLVTIVTYLS